MLNVNCQIEDIKWANVRCQLSNVDVCFALVANVELHLSCVQKKTTFLKGDKKPSQKRRL